MRRSTTPSVHWCVYNTIRVSRRVARVHLQQLIRLSACHEVRHTSKLTVPSRSWSNTLNTKCAYVLESTVNAKESIYLLPELKKCKVAYTRLPNEGFRSWSWFLAVSLQVTWVINPAVGCHYFPPDPQLTSQPLRGLLPISLLAEQRHNGCEQFA